MSIISYMPLRTRRERDKWSERRKWNTLNNFSLGLWNHCIMSLWMNLLLVLRCFQAANGWMVTWECFDVAAGNSWRIGLKPATELCQMINNMDLVNDVCSCQQSPFLSLRILFFWEALRGKLSCFHVKGALLSVCFPGCLKLFTMQGGFQSLCLYLSVFVRF